MPAPVIAIENLTKRYGAVLAIDDLSFTVEPGLTVAVAVFSLGT